MKNGQIKAIVVIALIAFVVLTFSGVKLLNLAWIISPSVQEVKTEFTPVEDTAKFPFGNMLLVEQGGTVKITCDLSQVGADVTKTEAKLWCWNVPFDISRYKGRDWDAVKPKGSENSFEIWSIRQQDLANSLQGSILSATVDVSRHIAGEYEKFWATGYQSGVLPEGDYTLAWILLKPQPNGDSLVAGYATCQMSLVDSVQMWSILAFTPFIALTVAAVGGAALYGRRRK